MAKVVYAIHSTNPWYPHLDQLTQHLGFESYYVIPVDQLHLAQTLAHLPEDVKLIFITATSTDQPTRLEDFKSAGYGKRQLGNLVNTPEKKFDVPGDIHRHILSFLPGKEVAALSGVSRQWRKAAGVSSDWRLWHQLAQQELDSKLSLEEFKKMGATPAEAYIESDKVGVYIRELKRLAREDPDSVDDLDDSPLSREVEKDFDFQVTIPVFARIYKAITSALRRKEITDSSIVAMRNLVTNLGQTGSIEDIIEFLSFLSILSSEPPDHKEAVNQWIAGNPTVREPLRDFLEFEESYVGEKLLNDLLAANKRKAVDDAVLKWAQDNAHEELVEDIQSIIEKPSLPWEAIV